MEYLKTNLEYEKKLLNELPENLRKIFKEKLLKNKDAYWKTLAEARVIVVFLKKLNFLENQLNIDVKTFKDKDVDLVVDFEDEKVYLEVKGFNPDKETTGDGSSFFMINTGNDDIKRALKRPDDKFLENSCNIVLIADEDILHPLANKNKTELDNIFNANDFKKTSAFIVLGPLHKQDPFEESEFLLDPPFRFTSITYNPNAQKQVPDKLKSLLEKLLN